MQLVVPATIGVVFAVALTVLALAGRRPDATSLLRPESRSTAFQVAQRARTLPATIGTSLTILEEDFAANRRGWPNEPHATAWLEPGGYHLFAREPGRFVAIGAPGMGPVRDAIVTASFRKVGGPPGGGYGIIVHDQGPGPRDGLMTGLAARGHSIRVVRTGLEVTVLVTGWLLGGTVGVGTVLYAVSIGPIAHVFIPLFARGRPTPEGALEAV